MRRAVSLSRTSVGKKVLMALSGVLLVGFVLGHMAGNLKVFQGAEAFNAYAEWIREFGYPALPHYGFLWIARTVLLAAVGVHVWAAWRLWRTSRAARNQRYRKQKDLSFSYASRTMRWGGVILLVFIVYHILHFTTGQAHTHFVEGDVYRNFVVAFRNPLVLGAYFVAQAALCLHIYHGAWSAFQTLGANHPRINHLRRPLASAIAIAIFVGFMIPPVSVAVGAVGSEVPRSAAVQPDATRGEAADAEAAAPAPGVPARAEPPAARDGRAQADAPTDSDAATPPVPAEEG